MKAGRKKTIFTGWDGWEQEIIDLYASGASDVEVRAHIVERTGKALSNDLFYRLLDENTIFSETINRGRDLCAAWWERQGRLGLWVDPDGKKISPAIWQINMRNRFGWDKNSISLSVKTLDSKSDDELDDEINSLTEREID